MTAVQYVAKLAALFESYKTKAPIDVIVIDPPKDLPTIVSVV